MHGFAGISKTCLVSATISEKARVIKLTPKYSRQECSIGEIPRTLKQSRLAHFPEARTDAQPSLTQEKSNDSATVLERGNNSASSYIVSTISAGGIRKMAPRSCIISVLRSPDLICPNSARTRHTLINIRYVGQFVLNLAGVNVVDNVIPTAMRSESEIDEFTVAGLRSLWPLSSFQAL